MSAEQDSPCFNILENRAKYVESLYNSCFAKVKIMIINKSGTEDDAYDLFHDAFLVLIQNCGKKDFRLTCTPGTFLYSVSRRLWLKRLRERGLLKSIKPERDDETIIYMDDQEMQRERLVASHFLSLGENCRQILKMSVVEGMPGKAVAEKLEFESYGYYRLAKKRCLDRFFNNLAVDHNWNNLKT